MEWPYEKCSRSSQGLALQGVSLVCCMHSIVIFGFSALQASCLQRLSLPAVDSVWGLAWMRQVLTRRLSPPPLELRPCKTPCLGDMVWAWVCGGLWRKGPLHWDWRKCDWKGSLIRVQGCGASSCKKLGSQCLHCIASSKWLSLCFGSGERNGASQLLCSWRGISLNAAFQGHVPRRANNLCTVCPRHSSNLCFHMSDPQVVCLPSFQGLHSALWALLQPSLLSFKRTGFKPHWCKNSRNLAPLLFQVSGFGEMFLCVPVCSSLLPFSTTSAPSLSQYSWSVSPLNHVSALPTSSVWPLCFL